MRKGVRQGCVLSPYLFNIVAEMAMREALEGYNGGIAIGGRMISNLRYADDIVLLAGTIEELQDLVTRLEKASEQFGLIINVDKTKVMATEGTPCQVFVNGCQIEQVSSFQYLGSVITDDSGCSEEIRSRLCKAGGVCSSLRKIWRSHNVNIPTKIRLWKALVWPVATYGCESWTLKKSDEDRVRAFEMKGLRRILRVSWTERKTNEWVLEKACASRELLESVKRRKMSYFGHIMRKADPCLEKDVIEGTTPGRRRKGRPRTAWIDNVKVWSGMTLEQALRSTADRDFWRRTVNDAANPRIEDG